MLGVFLKALSDDRSEAVTQLVTGNGVGLVVSIMAAGGMDTLPWGLEVLLYFLDHAEARERLVTEKVASQLIRSSAGWLAKVCDLIVRF